jgi:hypothetical protein
VIDRFMEWLGDLLVPDTQLFWDLHPRERGELVRCRGYTPTVGPGYYRVTRSIERLDGYVIYGKRV